MLKHRLSFSSLSRVDSSLFKCPSIKAFFGANFPFQISKDQSVLKANSGESHRERPRLICVSFLEFVIITKHDRT